MRLAALAGALLALLVAGCSDHHPAKPKPPAPPPVTQPAPPPDQPPVVTPPPEPVPEPPKLLPCFYDCKVIAKWLPCQSCHATEPDAAPKPR